jgi:3-dehydroquinate dehydratase-2
MLAGKTPTPKEGNTMPKILIVHGAGMNMRGKSQIEIFGKMTLPEYDEHIRRYASELGFDVEIFHSNIEGEAINKFYAAHDAGVDAAIINPAGFTTGYPALVAAIAQVKFPVIELHISNPARRGRESEIARATRGVVTGFGIYGYYIAMLGIKDILTVR